MSVDEDFEKWMETEAWKHMDCTADGPRAGSKFRYALWRAATERAVEKCRALEAKGNAMAEKAEASVVDADVPEAEQFRALAYWCDYIRGTQDCIAAIQGEKQ